MLSRIQSYIAILKCHLTTSHSYREWNNLLSGRLLNEFLCATEADVLSFKKENFVSLLSAGLVDLGVFALTKRILDILGFRSHSQVRLSFDVTDR